jgi:ATP-dependent DNA ligase
MNPMLALPVDGDPMSLITNNDWALEPKIDGRRVLVDIADGKVRAFSRKGNRCDLPPSLAHELGTLVSMPPLMLDGELMADGLLWAFDLPRGGELITPSTEWITRRRSLGSFLQEWRPKFVRELPYSLTTASKRARAKRLVAGGFEGGVFKLKSGLYQPGPRRTGVWTKWKLVKTVDVVVMGACVDGKENLELGLWPEGADTSDFGQLVSVGTCSRFEGDAPRARIGDVIEIAFLNSGAVESPRLTQCHARRLRGDEKDPSECTWDQLLGSHARREVPA